MVSTLLTPGCDECYGCDTPPPPSCKCNPDALEVESLAADWIQWSRSLTRAVRISPNDWYKASDCDWEYADGPYLFFPSFTDSRGIAWGATASRITISSLDLIPEISITYNFRSTSNESASVRFYKKLADCECIPTQTITGWSVEYIAWPASTPTFATQDELSLDHGSECGGCGSGCCDSLESTGITSVNKWNIGIAADSCRPFAELGLKTLTKTSPCTYVWIQGASSGACFNDSVGEDWEHIGDTFVVTSVNTASNRPCTTAYLRMLFARISDSAGAYLEWVYDYDYCEYTAGALSLLATNHTFPNGAPTFPSVSVIAV